MSDGGDDDFPKGSSSFFSFSFFSFFLLFVCLLQDVVLMPYTVNTNSMVSSTPLTPPPSYDNMAYTKKEEL